MNTNNPGMTKDRTKRLTIGMLISGLSHYQLMWLGAVDYARAQGVNLVCFVGGVQARPGTGAFASNVVFDLASVDTLDGLIVWGSHGAGVLENLDEAETREFLDRYRGLPIVNVETPMAGIPCVFTDTRVAMRQMIDHVIETHQRRRIALIRGPDGHFETQERVRAWSDTLEAHGLVVDERLSSPPVGWGDEDGAAAMRLLLDERHLRPGVDFDALVVTEVQYAVGALVVLQERGVAVPGEVSVVGFNDVVSAETVVPAVTTMRKPFYESGRRALQTVLALVRGEPAPDLVDVQAEMVIRRSCGCWPDEISTAGFLGDVEVTRAQVAPALTRVLAGIAAHMSPDLLARSVEQLVSAFWAGLEAPGDVFLSTFESVMRQVSLDRGQVSRWHLVLSALREYLRPLLDSDQLAWAEVMWQQARTLVGHQVQRSEIAFRLERVRQSDQMRALGMRMMLGQSVADVTRIIAQELPGMGIRSGYLALYDDPERPLDGVRLVLAWRDSRRIELSAQEQHYPTRQLLPHDVWPNGRSYQVGVFPLDAQEQPLGFAVFEIGPADGNLYSSVQQEIVNALQGAFLIEQRRQAETELVQERALLRTLIDNLPDYVYIKDRQSRFVLNNAAHIRVLGARSQEELLGKTDFDFFPSEFASQYYEVEQALMARDESMIDYEEEVIDQATGEHQWGSTTKVPLHDAAGRVTGLVGLTRDVTKIKQVEADLEQYAEAMARRAVQLQTASEVARDTTSVRELGDLLNRVVDLVHDRFGFDYVGVFLVDDQGEYAVLAAATGEVGGALLAQGHRRRVGQEGIIGHVAMTGEFRTVFDVAGDDTYVLNPLLPDTRSEVVLPLQVGGQVIGVLDMQSARVAGFDEEDVAALSIVADQLAVAIQNVRLFEQMQQTVRELQASTAQYTREAWQKLAHGAQPLGYRYRRLGVEPAPERSAEAARALELGEPVVGTGTEQPDASGAVAVPVKLRDQVVGVLNLRFQGGAVPAETVSLIEQVANRLALSMESARLLQDTRRRAVRDRLLSQVAARMGESLDIHTVLRNSVREMRAALGLKEVEIRMGSAPVSDEE